MAQENDIVIKVDVDVQKVQSELNQATAKLQEMKSAQSDLNKQFKEGKIDAEEYGRATNENKKIMADLTKTIKDNTAMVAAATIEEVKANATLDEKRAALNALQKAYGQMTEEQKKAEIGGKTLTDRIKELSDAVKEEEAAIGDNRRNVGNYEEAIKSVVPGMGKMSSILGTLKKLAMLAAGGFTALAAGIKAALASMLKFLATPAGAIIAAIAVALVGLAKAFSKLNEQIKKNDDASTAFARIYATTIQPIIESITAVFTKLADIVGKAAGKVADFFAKFSDAGKAADERVKAIDNLEEAERQYVENNAKRNNEIAKLRAQAMDTEHYTGEERRNALQQALELEKQDLADKKALAAERLRLLEEEARINGDTSDAMKDRIVQARAEMLNAETDYYNGTLKMQKQLQSFNREIDAEDQRRLEEYKKRMAERKKAAVEAYWEEREQREILERQAATKAVETRMEIEEDAEEDNIDEWLAKQKELIEKKHALLQPDLRSDAQRQRDEELQWLQELNDAKLLTVEQYEQAKAEIEKRYQENQMLMVADGIAFWSDQIMGTISAVNEAVAASERAELEDYKRGQEQKKKELDKQLAAGEISEAKHAEEVARIDEDLDRKEKEMQREQAKREKALGIMNAVISTAAAIIGFLANPGGIPGIALAAMAGVTGAAQAATIAAEPIPQFATGGIVPGTSYTGDNVTARLNSGEMVLNKESQQRLFDALSADNGQTLGMDYELMAEAMANTPAPVVVYTEMQEFGQKVATYNEIAKV